VNDPEFRNLCERTIKSLGPMGRGWVYCQSCHGVPSRLDLSQGWQILTCSRCNGSGYEQETPQPQGQP